MTEHDDPFPVIFQRAPEADVCGALGCHGGEVLVYIYADFIEGRKTLCWYHARDYLERELGPEECYAEPEKQAIRPGRIT